METHVATQWLYSDYGLNACRDVIPGPKRLENRQGCASEIAGTLFYTGRLPIRAGVNGGCNPIT